MSKFLFVVFLFLAVPCTAQGISTTLTGGVSGTAADLSGFTDIGSNRCYAEPWFDTTHVSFLAPAKVSTETGVDGIFLFGPDQLGVIGGVDSQHGARIGFVHQYGGLQFRAMYHTGKIWQFAILYDLKLSDRTGLYFAVEPATDVTEYITGFSYTWRK